MASSFSANQYQDAFRSHRLQQYTVAKQYKERPSNRSGNTKVVANDVGHLLPGVPRSPASPWGDFKGTWDLPNRIPGNHLANQCARKPQAEAAAAPCCESSFASVCEKVCAETCKRVCAETCKRVCAETCEKASAAGLTGDALQAACERACAEACQRDCFEVCRRECIEACKARCPEEADGEACRRACDEECKRACARVCKMVCAEVCKKACGGGACRSGASSTRKTPCCAGNPNCDTAAAEGDCAKPDDA